MAMKFSNEDGTIITVNVDPKVIRECYAQSLKVAPYLVKVPTNNTTLTIEVLNFPEEQNNVHPKEYANVQ